MGELAYTLSLSSRAFPSILRSSQSGEFLRGSLLLWCYNSSMKKKAVKDISINTRYPPDLLDELRKLAVAHERSLNGEIVWALRQYVEQQKKTK
jgi:hypothetical protein